MLQQFNRRDLKPVAFLVFINFIVFKDQLTPISKYLYAPCVDQEY